MQIQRLGCDHATKKADKCQIDQAEPVEDHDLYECFKEEVGVLTVCLPSYPSTRRGTVIDMAGNTVSNGWKDPI